MKSPSRSRFYPLYVGAAAYLLVSLGLRILLRIDFAPAGMPRGTDLAVFLVGLRMDLAAAAWIFLPMVVWLTVIPDRLFRHPVHRALFIAALAASVFALVFTTIAEWNFFDEFNARFNTVAVDYLIYPQEVFVNLWDSYPVGKVLLLCASLAVASVFAMRRLFRDVWDAEAPIRGRIKVLAIYVAVGVVATRTVAMKDTRIYNRVASEISSNGAYSFVYAATTRHLDYPGFYRTIDRADAFARTKRLVSEPNAVADAAADSIRRHITSTGDGRPKNVVILLIESFGSEFWGSLGRPGETLTPEMDKLSQEGLLFTSLYASGNRTVRGMEGVLASFPPLPGDSIVKRNQSDHVATLARTLKAQGYNTLFIYGGRGVFDGMRSFTTRNGYDRFIEQKDFKNPTFTTIWGVCDEDLYRRGVEELRALHDTGKPFFVTMLSVSNHKPYTYPKGRIPEDPDQHARPFAVKYTDWSLGEFFRLAKKEAFWNDTVFAVVADHGARVYGHQTIPIESYRIPLLVVGPSAVPKPARVGVLGGSLDVGPTVLGLAGVSYDSVFFGRDLLNVTPGSEWAVMNHNRDIGLYRDGKLAILGLNRTVEFYRAPPGSTDLEPWKPAGGEASDLEKDATALFQVADELYTSEKYRAD